MFKFYKFHKFLDVCSPPTAAVVHLGTMKENRPYPPRLARPPFAVGSHASAYHIGHGMPYLILVFIGEAVGMPYLMSASSGAATCCTDHMFFYLKRQPIRINSKSNTSCLELLQDTGIAETSLDVGVLFR